MSVTSATPANTGLSGETKGPNSSEAARSHRAAFRVKAAAGDTWEIISEYFKNEITLPYPGRVFDVGNGRDTRAKCVSIRGDLIEDSEGHWLVYATYEELFNSFTGPQDQNGKPSDDPDDWHDEIEVTTTQLSIAVERALYVGTTIGDVSPYIKKGQFYKPCNSTGKPFDPGIEEELDITVVRITKYQPVYDDTFYVKYINTVNSKHFNIHKPDYNFSVRIHEGTAKMKAINSSYHVTEKGKKYWKHTVEIHINLLGWQRSLLDRGTSERLTLGNVRRDGTIVTSNDLPEGASYIDEEIKDSDGSPISEPVNFNGRGRARGDTAEPPVYLIFQTLRLEDWNGIRW